MAAIALLGSAVAGPRPAAAAAPPFEYAPGQPQGTVGVSEPTIADSLTLQGGLTAGAVQFGMTLNGTAVPATISPDGSLISYRPPAPLTPGTYSVVLHLAVGQWSADSDWSFQVAQGSVVTLPAPGPAAAFALARLNSYRAKAGLPPLAASRALTASAGAHTRFYVANEARYGSPPSLSVHEENASWPGFTGVQPSDRGSYFGFAGGGVSEDMAFGSGVAGAVDSWMNSVFHRFAVTDPMAAYAGFAIAGQPGSDPNLPVTDLDVGEAGAGPSDPTETVVYPAPGQQGVPETFALGEIPDPLSAFAGARYPAGYPITVQFGSPDATAVTVSGASLTAGATAVPFYLLDAATVPPGASGAAAVGEMGDDVALIPQSPLQPGTTYDVQVAGSVTGAAGATHPFSRTWSFTTSGYADPGQLSATDSSDGAVTLTTTGDTSDASVYVGGYPVVGLTHADAHTMTFSIPPGLGASADLYVVQPDGQEVSWPGFVGSGGAVSPSGTPPGTTTTGGLQVAGNQLVPASNLPSLGLRPLTDASLGLTVVESASGQVLAAYRVGDPVGYLYSAQANVLRRVVFANPPVDWGGTVYVPVTLGAGSGGSGTGSGGSGAGSSGGSGAGSSGGSGGSSGGSAGSSGGSAGNQAPVGYTGPQAVTLRIGSTSYTADGSAASWAADLGTPFVTAGGRTMLPLRALSYVFGLDAADVTWFGPGGQAGTGPVQEVDLRTPWGTTIQVTASQIVRRGPQGAAPAVIPLDTAGLVIRAGRTFVPFRALGYAFGLDAHQISWATDPQTGAVTTVSFAWTAAP